MTLRGGLTLGPNSVILPAAVLGRHATVGPVSLVMRGESVPDKTRWIGNPIGPWVDDPDAEHRVTPDQRPADPYFPAYGDRSYAVEHYDLGLDYSLESNQLTARAVIDAVAADRPRPSCVLDLHELKVTKVSVEGNRVAKFSQSKGKLVRARSRTASPPGERFRLAHRLHRQTRARARR